VTIAILQQNDIILAWLCTAAKAILLLGLRFSLNWFDYNYACSCFSRISVIFESSGFFFCTFLSSFVHRHARTRRTRLFDAFSHNLVVVGRHNYFTFFARNRVFCGFYSQSHDCHKSWVEKLLSSSSKMTRLFFASLCILKRRQNVMVFDDNMLTYIKHMHTWITMVDALAGMLIPPYFFDKTHVWHRGHLFFLSGGTHHVHLLCSIWYFDKNGYHKLWDFLCVKQCPLFSWVHGTLIVLFLIIETDLLFVSIWD